MRNLLALFSLIIVTSFGSRATSQEHQHAPGEVNAEDTLQLANVKPTTERFKKATAAMRDHLRAMHRAFLMFNLSETPQDDEKHKNEWRDLSTSGIPIFDEFAAAGLEQYLQDPKQNEDLELMLARIVKQNVEHDLFEGMPPIIDALIENEFPDPDGQLTLFATMANFALNDFDKCKPYLKTLVDQRVASPQLVEVYEKYDLILADWAEELKLREADAKGEPLPRVLIRTSKGNIELELFENQAPETVANFINLAEQGFYDGLLFHRVIQHFMAQGGCPNGDGTGDPGYTIYNEAQKPNARKHWRGSVALALGPDDPNSGGSQFFIDYVPVPGLNGQYTVFGRVISGMQVAASLAPVNDEEKKEGEEKKKANPDAIITVEVLSKRDHPYEVRKVK